MTPFETALTVDFYRSLLAQHGDSVEAVGWDATNQRRRFEVLTHGWDFEGASICDVGCGRGDLWTWLKLGEHEHHSWGLYTGLDVVQEFVDFANDRTEGRCTLADAQTDPLPFCDYALASGVFNLDVGGGRGNPWWLEVVEKMSQVCRRGMAFDCLCTCREPQDARQVYRDPLTVFEVASRIESGAILSVRHNDPPGNLIVQVTKRGGENARGR